jgi:hypothetical protein
MNLERKKRDWEINKKKKGTPVHLGQKPHHLGHFLLRSPTLYEFLASSARAHVQSLTSRPLAPMILSRPSQCHVGPPRQLPVSLTPRSLPPLERRPVSSATARSSMELLPQIPPRANNSPRPRLHSRARFTGSAWRTARGSWRYGRERSLGRAHSLLPSHQSSTSPVHGEITP